VRLWIENSQGPAATLIGSLALAIASILGGKLRGARRGARVEREMRPGGRGRDVRRGFDGNVARHAVQHQPCRERPRSSGAARLAPA